jgi:hypothetical protein
LPFVTVSVAGRLCRDAQKGKRKIGKPSVPADEDAMRAGGVDSVTSINMLEIADGLDVATAQAGISVRL